MVASNDDVIIYTNMLLPAMMALLFILYNNNKHDSYIKLAKNIFKLMLN